MKTRLAAAALCAGLLLSAPLTVIAQDAGTSVEPNTDTDGVPDDVEAVHGTRIEAEVFSGFQNVTVDSESFSEFELGRAELGLEGWYGYTAAYELRLEGIRSSGPASALGVDGNSIVLRVKRAWGALGHQLGVLGFSVRGGMVADPWIEALETGYDLRGMSPLLSERAGLYDTSDLGAFVYADLWEGRIALRVSMTNGEGRNEIEQNNGKNLTLVLSGTPLELELLGENAALSIHATLRDGSFGINSAQNHRYGGALTFLHPRFGAGFEYAQASGFEGRPERELSALGFWLNGLALDPWIGAALRFDIINTDTSADDAGVTRMQVGLYSDLGDATGIRSLERLRAYVAYQTESFGDDASPLAGVPEAVDSNAILFLLSLRAGGALHSPSEEP